MNKKTIHDYILSSDLGEGTLIKISQRASASPYEALCYTLWEGCLGCIPEKFYDMPCEPCLSLATGKLVLEVPYQE